MNCRVMLVRMMSMEVSLDDLLNEVEGAMMATADDPNLSRVQFG